jgi:hypothetical protein
VPRAPLIERLRSPETHGPVLAVIVALMMAPVVVRTTADPDLWGHVRYGLDMIETRTLPSDDPYSFTQDIPWVNHEWLSELAMALAYVAGGTVGLVALKTLLLTSAMAIVWRAYAGAPLPVRGASVLMLLWGAASITATLRPQLWTLLGVVALCRLFMGEPRRWWLAGVPLMFVVWVNAHGGWIVGAGLLAVWTAGQTIWPQSSRALAIGIAASSALGTLINPYGWQMWDFLAGTVRFSRDISEWKPLFVFPVTDWLPWVAMMIVVLVVVFRSPRPPLVRLAMIAMLAYSSVRVIRIAPLCVAAALVLLQPQIAQLAPAARLTFTPLTHAAARGLAVALAVLVLASGFFVTRAATCVPFNGPWVPDRTAGRVLADAALDGKIVTWFDWGQYALWHLSPGLRVSMDGRRETIYSAGFLETHFDLYEARPRGLTAFQTWNAEYVWLPNQWTALRDWLVDNGYRLDVQTRESFVAVRKDLPALAGAGAPIGNCFPGP